MWNLPLRPPDFFKDHLWDLPGQGRAEAGQCVGSAAVIPHCLGRETGFVAYLAAGGSGSHPSTELPRPAAVAA